MAVYRIDSRFPYFPPLENPLILQDSPSRELEDVNIAAFAVLSLRNQQWYPVSLPSLFLGVYKKIEFCS